MCFCLIIIIAGKNRVCFGWAFVILSSGLGKDEWVILIKAFTLLPLVYWDATRDAKEDTDIEGRSPMFHCCLLRYAAQCLLFFGNSYNK